MGSEEPFIVQGLVLGRLVAQNAERERGMAKPGDHMIHSLNNSCIHSFVHSFFLSAYIHTGVHADRQADRQTNCSHMSMHI